MDEAAQPAWIKRLPKNPGLYAMCGGQGRNLHIAYAGEAENLRARIAQHLVRRDSSVVTGTSAAGLNPDRVTQVRWWVHPDFGKKHIRQAAEMVAWEVLGPALSPGSAPEKVRTHPTYARPRRTPEQNLLSPPRQVDQSAQV